MLHRNLPGPPPTKWGSTLRAVHTGARARSSLYTILLYIIPHSLALWRSRAQQVAPQNALCFLVHTHTYTPLSCIHFNKFFELWFYFFLIINCIYVCIQYSNYSCTLEFLYIMYNIYQWIKTILRIFFLMSLGGLQWWCARKKNGAELHTRALPSRRNARTREYIIYIRVWELCSWQSIWRHILEFRVRAPPPPPLLSSTQYKYYSNGVKYARGWNFRARAQ